MIFFFFRNPVAQSTDGARGKIGFRWFVARQICSMSYTLSPFTMTNFSLARSGRHAWEVIWEGPLGTVAVIGD